jgi:hypothetical protein
MGTMMDPGRGVRQVRAAVVTLILVPLLGAAGPAPATARGDRPHPATADKHAARVGPAPVETLDMANFRAP